MTADGKVGLNWIEKDCTSLGSYEFRRHLTNVLLGHNNPVCSVVLTEDGRWALTGSQDHTARLWDLSNPGSSPRVLSGHTGTIYSVALTPDGKWALTGSDDCTARLWDLSNSGVVLVFFRDIRKRYTQ